MTWITQHGLATRINDLPLVLAGPILRRTESHSVSVWVALRDNAGPLRLHIYELGSQIPRFSTPILSQSNLVQLGARLFVGLITAKVPISSLSRLTPGQTYEYDIEFGDLWAGSTLSSIGILNNPNVSQGGIVNLIYAGGPSRPSFSLPPASVNNLRVVHNSCRKAQGGAADASLALDWMLMQSITQPDNRLHQMYLTGDQIYADDVADAMLYMLRDAEALIIGWNESLPLIQSSDNLNPGHRAAVVKNRAELSVGEEPESAKSHLIRLSEFYLMYVFAWSPVLWVDQGTNLPEWNDVFPGVSTVEEYSGTPTPVGPTPSVEKKEHKVFTGEIEQLNVFRSATYALRRVMANVPTYMMFDDHELTDDVFLDLDWCRTVINNALGKRILQNALSAFAVMQAWGNDPEHPEFGITQSTPDSLILKLKDLSVSGPSAAKFDSIAAKVVPRLSSQVTMYNQPGFELIDSIDFSVFLDFDYFKVIMVDSRSRRFFPTSKQAPALLSIDALNNQIINRLNSISPLTTFVFVITPAPIIGHAMWEGTVQPFLGKHIFDSRIVDIETWHDNTPAFEKVLEALNKAKRTVILSGDIHFSFSAEGKYWSRRHGQSTNVSSFAQLTCSAAKNSNTKTVLISTLGSANLEQFNSSHKANTYTIGLEDNPTFRHKLIQAEKDGDWFFKPSKVMPPEIYEFQEQTQGIRVTPGLMPVWSYRISFINDNRNADLRGVYTSAEQVDPYTPPSNPLLRDAYLHRREGFFNPYSAAVGADCVGEVTFSMNGTALDVTHALWYTMKGEPPYSSSEFRPFVVHNCTLDPFDNEQEPRP
ncbi:hypothetical protein GCM10023185_33230 [Hymenobacter saemangeumensis]|uniref:PhoD-like phosphatase metallophosphatase domain-containing protein n=1 Tax=Hymenobacter saemangeumensis TaxID=1084522 RepID=A0ABP8IN81_9BACT